MNVAEELECDANAIAGKTQRFWGTTQIVWDSGAGHNICAMQHVLDYTLSPSDHPGFSGPSGKTIKVDGRTHVKSTGNTLGTTAEASFIVANQVTRPILSGGEVNDQCNITISSTGDTFVVDKSVTREACEALMFHAK